MVLCIYKFVELILINKKEKKGLERRNMSSCGKQGIET
jgi:hypothetical protein